MTWEKEFSIDELKDLAAVLTHELKHKIVLFEGEMGAGKTTLIQAICQHLGVENQMSSPTYSIVNEYEGREKIYHFDLFRLKNTFEALDFGIEEYLDSGNYCFIEWFETIKPLLPDAYSFIKLEKVNETTRKITVIHQ
uniref:tRNA (adenosine(37)-N6)-threonylcarbamoyltransferase complex ATPase subunit type 1 TsaE n=1 Tax=Flavobacterium sp. TaxID=239 RepID=UPI00404A83D9